MSEPTKKRKRKKPKAYCCWCQIEREFMPKRYGIPPVDLLMETWCLCDDEQLEFNQFDSACRHNEMLALTAEVERLQAVPQKIAELAAKWNTHDRWWEDKETLDTHRDELLALLPNPQTGVQT